MFYMDEEKLFFVKDIVIKTSNIYFLFFQSTRILELEIILELAQSLREQCTNLGNFPRNEGARIWILDGHHRR